MQSKGTVTKQLIIENIVEHIHLYGFTQTSMNDIIALTGVKKGNLYFHFKSKEELILQALKEAHSQYQEYLDKHTKSVSDPISKIEAMLDAVFKYHSKRNFTGGCIFGNTAAEMADKHPEFREFINSVFKQWTQWIENQLREGIRVGIIQKDTPVQELSHHIIAALEGGILLAKASKNKQDLHYAIQCIKTLLNYYKSDTTKRRR